MKKKKPLQQATKNLRHFLKSLAREKLTSKEDREKAAKYFDFSESTINGMVYRGEGSMDAWVTMVCYLYKIKTGELDDFFQEVKSLFRKRRKLSSAEIVWGNTEGKLSEDKKFFWCGVIQAVEEFKPSFTIRKNKK